ncbi:hypothetical protein AT864_03077 [Anoxybacillus sp. P3H1B]|uniref:hypothetical protein n=1 Tax=Anoxybacillus sp. P3H1B TaxID=1769293 RepID=UPI00079933BB|nr:hypothetical protein [Anoxybacillus sp. P3H1B]KXG08660.1 hypothetical protein AT864_03077 [Anoxybacillus sp. P3H1B]
MIKIGDRVYCKSDMYSRFGIVVYIDEKLLYVNHQFPVQIQLDEPDTDGHRLKRFNLREIKVQQ